MANESEYVGKLFKDAGISFTFPNLKNLSESNITYSQFLACVAQRLLLKQYTAHSMDSRNLLCSMKTASEIFDRNKESFGVGLSNLFLKNTTLSMINSQSSKNKVSKQDQSLAAEELVKWYASFWFERLKSEEMLESLEKLFEDAEVPLLKSYSGDWDVLRIMYESAKGTDFFDMVGIDSQVFINNADSIKYDLFDGILEGCYRFMSLSGSVETPRFKDLCSKEDLMVSTTSAFMLSTIYGINEIEDKKKRYTSPLDPYNMFNIFKDTSMSGPLRMNQMLFTTYNYFKILL